MRRDIEFKTEDGVMLRGWLYRPDGAGDKTPAIVMAHGFSAVKEMYLDRYGEAFASAGLAALVVATAISGQATASRASTSTRGNRCPTIGTPSPTPKR